MQERDGDGVMTILKLDPLQRLRRHCRGNPAVLKLSYCYRLLGEKSQDDVRHYYDRCLPLGIKPFLACDRLNYNGDPRQGI